jgi:hypothetical protein
MPNRLKMSKSKSILALRQQGWSFSRIALNWGPVPGLTRTLGKMGCPYPPEVQVLFSRSSI